MNKISVVVPCFNEEEVLSVFYKKTSEVLNEIDGITYELLFVDDGSKDHTKDILRALSLKDDRCEFVSFSRNFGKEAAMFAGLVKKAMIVVQEKEWIVRVKVRFVTFYRIPFIK